MDKLQEQILYGLNLFMGAKDKNSKYLFCNENTAKAAGLDSPQQIIGKTDYDLHWRDQAEIYREGDHKVFQGQTQVNAPEIQTQPDGTANIIVSKSQLLDKHNRCTGLMFSYIDISNYFVREKPKAFTRDKRKLYLGSHFGNEYLTRREVTVLKNILLGYTAKQIAKICNLSYRTVESHMEHIRRKLQCTTKGDIIVMAMKTGLTYTVLDENSWQE
ncbi:MAG: PAS domain-containing protein [Gammaproteobacteria bacterium]|nr:PAS domain-containing protein [Gammaproteobacteria bacterium]